MRNIDCMSVKLKNLRRPNDVRKKLKAFSVLSLNKATNDMMFSLIKHTIKHPSAKWSLNGFKVVKNELDGNLRIIIIKGENVQDYIFCKDDRGMSYVVSLPLVCLHSQIIEMLEESLHLDIKYLKGGMIRFDGDDVTLYGFSSIFGAADHKEISKILRSHGIKAHV